ncbi:Hsp20/alpha crystallin family protein [Virgibacillus sp. SK37]|uniref:Hsp20/alpha crystallin family protein n=1 Tax=Virgibacillus sp. SK37 TaxID=403957 RepID=UPI0004D1264F|nr:Hsp20/alpha crystallin family protein [Virgibacillus sp. SK37]AIF45483.1 hypothetical protein X953_13170 [Virgibacillus sp. SK37]
MDHNQNKSTQKSQPFTDLISRMDEFFSDAFRDFKPLWNNKAIPIETKETQSAIIIRAMLPGYTREQIELEIMGRQIRIGVQNSVYAEKKDDEQKYFHTQESYRKNERIITLPFPISKKDTTATYKNGVLTVNIPKNNADRTFISIS